MTSKIIKSSFILFSVYIVSSIITFVLFYLFNQDISRYSAFYSYIVAYSKDYVLMDSNVLQHYFQGLIFYGISLILAIVGIIFFIVSFFTRKLIKQNQIDKDTINDNKTGLLKTLLIMFVVVVALLLISLVYIIVFQEHIPSAVDRVFPGGVGPWMLSADLVYIVTAKIFLSISVILDVIGITLFAIGIFGKNKIMISKKRINSFKNSKK